MRATVPQLRAGRSARSWTLYMWTFVTLTLVNVSVNGQELFLPYDGDHDSPAYEVVLEKIFPQHGGGPGPGFGGGSGGIGPENIQASLLRVLDWNYELSPEESHYYCEGRMHIIEAMNENVTKNEFIYESNPNHGQLIQNVATALNSEHTPVDALSLAACMRNHINPKCWMRGLFSSMATGRGDLMGYYAMSLMELYPSEVMNGETVAAMRVQAALPPDQRQCIQVNGAVGRDNGEENLLWYWREDVMVNTFHWYWHLSYPFMIMDGAPAVRADRRGELFYYTHHSIVARYRIERMSVGLPPLVPLELTPGQVVEEGYNPHLTDSNAGMNWQPRREGRVIRDTATRVITGTNRIVSVTERLREILAIEEAIQNGFAISDSGLAVPLLTPQGIDILGDMVEAAMWSVNQDLYGNPGPHNDGHFLIGLIEDQLGLLNLPPGVMADPATAMRDPVFYRYHISIDAVFNRHKRTLAPYELEVGDFPLLFPGIRITGFALRSVASSINSLETYFVDRIYDVSRGLDFNGTFVNGPVPTCVKHLDHQPFAFELGIERDESVTSRATVRIFIAPRYNEHGERFTMEEQRLLFVQLDRFPVTLTPGLNLITRPATESTLTIPFPQSLQEFQLDTSNETPFCGCGWPEHLLMPRGTAEGQEFDMFVIVTDGDLDAVQFEANTGPGAGCRPAPIFCGIQGQRYPDRRPMGYPFDRRPYRVDSGFGPRQVQSLEEYIEPIPNSAAIQIRILHRGGDAESSIESYVPYRDKYSGYFNPFDSDFKERFFKKKRK